jgi:hypothetical protein
MKWFKIYPQKWLLGSTRWELSLEERALFIDFLSLASLNDPPGEFSFFSLSQLADQCRAPQKVVENAIEHFVLSQKIEYFPKKNKIRITNWKKYQSEYERQKPYRPREKASNKVTPKVVTKLLLEREGEGEGEIEIEGEEKEKEREIKEGEPSNSKKQFFSILKSFPSYPFQEDQDGQVFDHLAKKIDIAGQTRKKIAWWKENPKAIHSKKKPMRQQLIEFFLEEVEFQEGKAK